MLTLSETSVLCVQTQVYTVVSYRKKKLWIKSRWTHFAMWDTWGISAQLIDIDVQLTSFSTNFHHWPLNHSMLLQGSFSLWGEFVSALNRLTDLSTLPLAWHHCLKRRKVSQPRFDRLLLLMILNSVLCFNEGLNVMPRHSGLALCVQAALPALCRQWSNRLWLVLSH